MFGVSMGGGWPSSPGRFGWCPSAPDVDVRVGSTVVPATPSRSLAPRAFGSFSAQGRWATMPTLIAGMTPSQQRPGHHPLSPPRGTPVAHAGTRTTPLAQPVRPCRAGPRALPPPDPAGRRPAGLGARALPRHGAAVRELHAERVEPLRPRRACSPPSPRPPRCRPCRASPSASTSGAGGSARSTRSPTWSPRSPSPPAGLAADQPAQRPAARAHQRPARRWPARPRSMAGVRYGWRLVLERSMRPRGDGARRVLVFGAGEGGMQTITAMLRNPRSPYLPVALLDDDPAKRNLRIMGVRVVGGRDGARPRPPPTTTPTPSSSPSPAPAPSCSASCATWPPTPTSQILRAAPDHRAVRRRHRRRRHPPAHRGRPARPPRDRHRRRRHRRLPHRPAGARHRRRRLDRLRAVPPDRPLRPGRAGHARPRRVGPARRCSCASRAGPCSTTATSSSPTSATPSRHGRRSSPSTGPRSCSTPPRSSTCRCSRCTRARRSRPTCGAPSNVLDAAEPHGVERFVNISTDKAADPISVLGYTQAHRRAAHRRRRRRQPTAPT